MVEIINTLQLISLIVGIILGILTIIEKYEKLKRR